MLPLGAVRGMVVATICLRQMLPKGGVRMASESNTVLPYYLTDCVCPFCGRKFIDRWPWSIKPIYTQHRHVVPCRRCLPDSPEIMMGTASEYERRKAEANRKLQPND